MSPTQMFEPFVELAVRGRAMSWLPASARGRTSYTVFATTRQRLDADPEPFRRMVRATMPHPAMGRGATAKRWPRPSPATSRHWIAACSSAALARYKAQGVWADSPILSEEGFDRLRRALLASGFLHSTVPFADCIDNRLAEEAASL